MTTYTPDEIKTFQIMHDGYRINSLTCSLTLFIGKDFRTIVEPLLLAYESFFRICPRERIRWYITENMSRYKPVTNRTFGLFEGWLRQGPEPRPFIHIHLRDGENYIDTPEFGLWIWGLHEGEGGYGMDSNVIRFHFPAEYAWKETELMYRFTSDVASCLPIRSGVGGLTLEWSGFYQEASDVGAWRLSMDHPGLDIANEITDAIAVGQDGIKGVSWLTLLDNHFVEELGGEENLRRRLPPDVGLMWAGKSLIIRATPTPLIGWLRSDESLENYKAVFRIVAPLMQRTANRYGGFTFPLSIPLEERARMTRDWVMRLSNGL